MALRHVLLTVLAREDMTGYDITKAFEQVYAHFWHASHQQVYRELSRLGADGGVRVRVIAQEGRPDKKVYSITEAGIDELRQWVVAPTGIPRSNYDLLVKLLGCGVVGRKVFRPELDRIRAIAEKWLGTLQMMRAECLRQRDQGWSEHEQVLYLALRRGLLLGEAQSRWLNEIDAYLGSGQLPD